MANPAVALPSSVSCNGHPQFCNRIYSNVTLIGSHDSVFVGPLPQQNQNIDIPAQLDMGIRFLQAQTHKAEDGTLELCHTSCLLEDAGPLQSFLVTVKTWIDSHPNEVVTLLLTNGNFLPVSDFDKVFTDSGIKPYVFVPTSTPKPLPIHAWPTLQEMISNNTRLVVFLDYGADPSTAAYILDEFAYYFETPYDVTNPSFPQSDCSINRPPSASATGRMYIVNHFLDVDLFGILIPDRLEASRTNAATGWGSIGAQSSVCESMYHRPPNVVLVDFVNKGQVIKAQNMLNGL